MVISMKAISVDASLKWRIYIICDDDELRIIHFGLIPSKIKRQDDAEEFAIRRAVHLFRKYHKDTTIYNDNKEIVRKLSKKMKWKHISIKLKNPNFADNKLKEIVRWDIYNIKPIEINKYASINFINPELKIGMRW